MYETYIRVASPPQLSIDATRVEDNVEVKINLNFVFRNGGADGKLRGERGTYTCFI